MDWSCKTEFIPAGVLQLQLDFVMYADKLWTVDRFRALIEKGIRKYIMNSGPDDIHN